MPNITVEMQRGRTIDQRQRFAKAVTDAAVEILDAKPEVVRILFVEFGKSDVAKGGVLASIREEQEAEALATAD